MVKLTVSLVILLLGCISCGGANEEDVMPAGFEVTGDNSNLQIYQDYSNYHLRSSGHFTAGSFSAAGNYDAYTARISVSNTESPVLCLRPTGQGVYVSTAVRSGNTARWDVVAPKTSGISVYWYVFDSGVSSQDQSPGVTVYRANGDVAFNSNAKFMSVVGTTNLTKLSAGTNSPPTSKTVSGFGGDIAICGFPIWHDLLMGGNNLTNYYVTTLRISGSSLIMEGQLIAQQVMLMPNQDPYLASGQRSPATVLRIDTSNL